MPKSLSEALVRNSKPQTRPYKISDRDGLFLLITPSGAKYWRLRYFIAGKEKLLALGVYPEVTLADARERRSQARKLLASGKDPGETKKEAKRAARVSQGNTLEVVAREWYEKRRHEWAPASIRCKSFYLETKTVAEAGSQANRRHHPAGSS
jgi:hypothetical protein